MLEEVSMKGRSLYRIQNMIKTLLKPHWLAGSVLFLFYFFPLSAAQEIEINAEALKAAFLHNFPSFINWPNMPETLDLCILGESPFGKTLEALNRQAQLQDAEQTLRIQYHNRVQGLENCHMVYISDSEKYRQTAILDHLANHPIVTVSSLPNFARRGGHIEFFTVQKRVRFYINNTMLKQQKLKAGANLLRVAADVF